MKHLMITCLGYFFLGFAMAIQQTGIKAGWGFWGTTVVFTIGLVCFVFSAFTSLQKLKDFIKKHEAKAPGKLKSKWQQRLDEMKELREKESK